MTRHKVRSFPVCFGNQHSSRVPSGFAFSGVGTRDWLYTAKIKQQLHPAFLRDTGGLLLDETTFIMSAPNNNNNNNNHGMISTSQQQPSSSQQQQQQQLTASQQKALRRVTKIVDAFVLRNDCAPFLEPVDWRGLELYDYPTIIKKPMDLGTIQRKLERNQYPSAAYCVADIRRVWSNCMTYNTEGSDFYVLAKNCSKRFEDRYRRIRNECT